MKKILYFVRAVVVGIVFVSAVLVVAPGVAVVSDSVVLVRSAQAQSIKEDGLVPCGTSKTPPCTIDHFFVLIARVTNFLIVFAGAYAVFMLIVSGFRLVSSRGDVAMATKAKSGLTNALIGFILVMIAFAAVNTFVYRIFGLKGANLIGNPLNVQIKK